MSEAATQTTATPTPSAPSGVVTTPAAPADDGADGFEARLQAMRGDAGPAAEGGVSPSPASPSGADSDAAKRATERAARLAALGERMRKQVDSRPRASQQGDELAKKYEDAQRQLQELQAAQANYVDPTKLDEAGFFQLANKLQVSPQKLGEFLRTATLNPEVVAAQAAQKALDPRIAAAEERAAKAERMVQEFLAEQQQAQAQAAAHAAKQQFVQSITPAESPRAATFLKAFGPGEFLKIAESAADGLPLGAGRQALLDVIEENLEQLARAFVPDSPSNGKQTPPNPTAAAKAPTVSNALAQQRASVVEDDDWASLPFEERLERMKASA